ncbi:MAG TPA: hypothetical protein VFL99_06205 [Segeticoccus sp.]|uniref:hypothetical protein n=1 Tax=Segeticoccus sp. TaxID=2706531 RepID=UPI002D80596C|nr:hypothetical protein [Segeticoccus sp.]HET8599899.1 hypothetical protein [Segeticoccus sp.]
MSESEATSAPDPTPGEPATPLRLFAQAATTSKVLWITVPGDRAWPAWHAWVEDTAYVVSGPGEQHLPELPERVEVTLRSKDTGGRLVRATARAERVVPEDDRWEAATAALKAGRLNAPAGDTVQRWAEENVVTALVPLELLEQPGRYDDRSGAAAPVPSPARTDSWLPWHARGRPHRRRRLRRTEPDGKASR